MTARVSLGRETGKPPGVRKDWCMWRSVGLDDMPPAVLLWWALPLGALSLLTHKAECVMKEGATQTLCACSARHSYGGPPSVSDMLKKGTEPFQESRIIMYFVSVTTSGHRILTKIQGP